jgi:hypothetical protein
VYPVKFDVVRISVDISTEPNQPFRFEIYLEKPRASAANGYAFRPFAA